MCFRQATIFGLFFRHLKLITEIINTTVCSWETVAAIRTPNCARVLDRMKGKNVACGVQARTLGKMTKTFSENIISQLINFKCNFVT